MVYKKIFLTNLPAFYKINLFNEINKKQKILVVFTGEDSIKRNKDFSNTTMEFDKLDLSKKNKLFKILTILKLIWTYNFDEIIVGGWDQLYYWIVALLNRTKKNGVIVESSIFESQQIGIKRIVKKIFLKKFVKIYVSGIAQKKLVESILGNDKILKNKYIIKTGGVGIFRYQEQPKFQVKEKVTDFLYIGRLASEKNLELLIQVFNELPSLRLTIVGEGTLKKNIIELKKSNINLMDYVPNNQLNNIYRDHDVFILPSIIEPWGLVVQEALNNGLPLILSDKVGCYPDYIENKGLLFHYNDRQDLLNTVKQITDISNYNFFAKEVSELNFEKLMVSQVLKFVDQ
jgi:glycosyltransferase involved in cell wall biosynthesis